MGMNMRIDIIGSIIITLVLMLICHALNLGLFGSILLMIFAFVVMNYRGRIKLYLYNVGRFFERKQPKVEVKSSYQRMELEDE